MIPVKILTKVLKKKKVIGKTPSITVISAVLLILFCCSIILPFVHEMAKSLSHPFQVDAGRVNFVPKEFTWGNYYYYVRKQLKPLSRALFNTLFLVFVGGVLSVGATVLFAFPLSRSRTEFRLGRFIIYIVVFCIIFQRPIIPLRITFQWYGLLNSLWAIVFNMLINPFFVILAITYFKSLPDELFDAARIDGADEFTTFVRIILPLCKPIIVTIFLMQAVGFWNSFLQARLFIIDINLYPIQNFIHNIMSTGGDVSDVDFLKDPFANSESVKSALVILSTIVPTAIYISLQKYFTPGLVSGSVKG